MKNDKQFNRYLQMDLDSVNECVVCSIIGKRQNYISAAIENQLRKNLSNYQK